MMIFRFGWLLRMRQRVLFPQQAKQVADHRYQVNSFLFCAVFLQGQEFLKVWGFFFVCRIKDFVGWYFQVCNQGGGTAFQIWGFPVRLRYWVWCVSQYSGFRQVFPARVRVQSGHHALRQQDFVLLHSLWFTSIVVYNTLRRAWITAKYSWKVNQSTWKSDIRKYITLNMKKV